MPGFASLSVRERVYPLKGVHDLDTPRAGPASARPTTKCFGER
jgi:hypothetical protein